MGPSSGSTPRFSTLKAGQTSPVSNLRIRRSRAPAAAGRCVPAASHLRSSGCAGPHRLPAPGWGPSEPKTSRRKGERCGASKLRCACSGSRLAAGTGARSCGGPVGIRFPALGTGRRCGTPRRQLLGDRLGAEPGRSRSHLRSMPAGRRFCLVRSQRATRRREARTPAEVVWGSEGSWSQAPPGGAETPPRAANLAQACALDSPLPPSLSFPRHVGPLRRTTSESHREAPGEEEAWLAEGESLEPAHPGRGGWLGWEVTPFPRVSPAARLWAPEGQSSGEKGPQTAAGRRRDPPATRSPSPPAAGRGWLASGAEVTFSTAPATSGRFPGFSRRRRLEAPAGSQALARLLHPWGGG